jgi:hypothetical protein
MKYILILILNLILFSGCASISDADRYSNANSTLSKDVSEVEELTPIDAVNFKRLYLSSLKTIDSLKSIIAFKDSNVIIMLQSIQDGLENISDEGLNNLIEMRDK